MAVENRSTLARLPGVFTVAPSPLNAVKFDLGLILVGALLLLLVQGRLALTVGWQLLLLFGYGLLGMTWLLLRTRRILTQTLAAARQDDDGPH